MTPYEDKTLKDSLREERDKLKKYERKRQALVHLGILQDPHYHCRSCRSLYLFHRISRV